MKDESDVDDAKLGKAGMQKLTRKMGKNYKFEMTDKPETDDAAMNDVKTAESNEMADRIRQTPEYLACSKFVVQKLKKNQLLLRSVLKKLIAKYGKTYPILKKVSDEVMQQIESDLFWVVGDDKVCLREIEELEAMPEMNEHRRRVIDWFGSTGKDKITEVAARKQWKALATPNEATFQIIMASLCDWKQSKRAWFLKSGKKKK